LIRSLAVPVARRSGDGVAERRAGGGGRSYLLIASSTSVRSKTPSSAASWAWRMTYRRRSPGELVASCGVALSERVVTS
jgi:hypothetical protein